MRFLHLNIWVGVGYHEGIGHCWRAPGFTGRISSWTSQQTGSYSKFSQFSFFSFKGDANLHDVFDSNDGYQIMTAFKFRQHFLKRFGDGIDVDLFRLKREWGNKTFEKFQTVVMSTILWRCDKGKTSHCCHRTRSIHFHFLLGQFLMSSLSSYV